MPDIKHPKCSNPKCGALMQRTYMRKRVKGKDDKYHFVPVGWLCDCRQMQKD
jgi:hypothetical protein